MLKPLAAALAVASFLALGACTQETRVEEEPTVGESLENAGDQVEDAADSVDDATDANPNTNP